MEAIKSVMDWDFIFDNCWWMWVICPLMFVLALIMRRSKDKVRIICGNILIGFSIPGMLIALSSFGMFVWMFFRLLGIVDPVRHQVNDISLLKDFNRIENSSLNFWILLIPVLPLQGLASLVNGSIVLNKGCGKAIGIVSVVMGILLILAGIFVTVSVMKVWGST